MVVDYEYNKKILGVATLNTFNKIYIQFNIYKCKYFLLNMTSGLVTNCENIMYQIYIDFMQKCCYLITEA